ncbi:hypothetical protein [Aporhodopirellula aestuarii]|uniref:Polyphosphate kinase-2-related domain-containing protein n=1 Tax=Aporhodopirellula aestuarii TaxID=2950107 RepID=A0ABT0U8W1_9BACT|nr:hypothetical protein [Aporhodopirellula aestuarii]MCM2373338.1 hypothetical protein [Aporhodopirellula aestuarii]
MRFRSDAKSHEILRSCPEFEYILLRSGIQRIKCWIPVSDEMASVTS